MGDCGSFQFAPDYILRQALDEDACARCRGDGARHSQGLMKVPRHIPRLAFRASSSAAT
jgi:hypothetical protein